MLPQAAFPQSVQSNSVTILRYMCMSNYTHSAYSDGRLDSTLVREGYLSVGGVTSSHKTQVFYSSGTRGPERPRYGFEQHLDAFMRDAVGLATAGLVEAWVSRWPKLIGAELALSVDRGRWDPPVQYRL